MQQGRTQKIAAARARRPVGAYNRSAGASLSISLAARRPSSLPWQAWRESTHIAPFSSIGKAGTGNVAPNEGDLMNRLKGKVAVVTGASKGIGTGIAEHLAAEGAAVVVNYATGKAGAEAVVKRIMQKDGKAVAVQADVSNPDDIRRLFAETKKAFGKLDVLVNNAGIYQFGALETVTPEHFHKQFNLNVLGLLLATQEAVKLIGPSGGSIINISSVVSTAAPAGLSVYSATKGAVDTITKSLAKELGPRKIRVNAINPGIVETEGTHAAGVIAGDMQKKTEAQTPLGRIGKPDDIAPAAVFLASNESAWITGETLYISGGFR
jgi:3-oxoacyl-[acyl-carrier protein] reductase